jgi:hypothetical protein
MFKVTCLVDPRRKVGTPRKLGLESPQKIVLAQCYLLWRNTSNQSIKCNKHGLYECTKKRGSDFENFGERITEFGAAVAKIWWQEVIGAYL